MSRGGFLSVLGLYNYDDTLFDNMVIPGALDKDVLIKNILLECAELEVIYPNTEILKQAIQYWSAKRLSAWDKIAQVLYEDYDPFINIKRDEERTITQSRDLTNNVKTNVNAYDDNTSDGVLRDSSVGKDTGTVTTHEKYHVEGDSAITDAQDVAMKEFKLRDEYNLYNYIVDDFKKRFCLLVY